VLLPDTTRVFVVTPDLPKAVKSFEKTQFGRLLADRQLKPFKAHLEAELKKQGSLDFLGFSLQELCDLSGGETGWGVIQLGPGKVGSLLFVDVTGKKEELKTYLIRQAQRWKQDGIRRETIAGERVLVVGGSADNGQDAALRGGFVKDNLMVMSDHLDLLRGVLGRWHGERTGSLAANTVYAETSLCSRPQGGETIQVRFYLDPLDLIERPRPDRSRGTKDPLDLVLRQGLEAFKGIGGFVTFDSPSYDIYYRVAIYAPPPYTRAMRMLRFPSGDDFGTEPWVPAHPASVYLTFNWDLVNALDSFDTVFDGLTADDSPGSFQEILDSLKNDPDGPQVDLRRDLVGELTNRVTYFIDSPEAPAARGTRRVAALATKNARKVEGVLERFLRDDPRVRRRVFGNQVVWEVPPGKREIKAESPSTRPETRLVRPTGGIAVARNHLFLANHVDLLEAILRQDEGRTRLRQHQDFSHVWGHLDRLGGPRTIGRLFYRPAEDLRVGYELIRTGQLERAETLYGRLLRFMLRGPNGAVRLDLKGELLPEFHKISHHFSAAGGLARNCPGGWELIGFALKQAPPSPNTNSGSGARSPAP
jgi:hypothetical protein